MNDKQDTIYPNVTYFLTSMFLILFYAKKYKAYKEFIIKFTLSHKTYF